MQVKAALAKIVRVGDVMSRRVITVEASATPTEAAEVLTKHKIDGAPVVQSDRVLGVVSKSDLIDPRHRDASSVDAVMTRLVYAVRESDPAYLAVQLMVDEAIHRAVVVDDLGRLCGIVAPLDILRAIREGKTIAPNAEVQVDYVDLRKLGGAH